MERPLAKIGVHLMFSAKSQQHFPLRVIRPHLHSNRISLAAVLAQPVVLAGRIDKQSGTILSSPTSRAWQHPRLLPDRA